MYSVIVKDTKDETKTDSVIITQPYKLVRITTFAGTDFDPHWSPDGNSFVFTSNRTGRNENWIIPAEGGTATQLTFQGGYLPAGLLTDQQSLLHRKQVEILTSGQFRQMVVI